MVIQMGDDRGGYATHSSFGIPKTRSVNVVDLCMQMLGLSVSNAKL